MSCDALEPLIFIYKAQRGQQAVTRHRRDCGTAARSLASPHTGGMMMTESEFLEYRRQYRLDNHRPYTQEPQDHQCMERRRLHRLRTADCCSATCDQEDTTCRGPVSVVDEEYDEESGNCWWTHACEKHQGGE